MDPLMSERQWAALWFTVFLVLFVPICLGIKACNADTRTKEAACQRAGGAMTTVGTSNGCYRVTAEPVATQGGR